MSSCSELVIIFKKSSEELVAEKSAKEQSHQRALLQRLVQRKKTALVANADRTTVCQLGVEMQRQQMDETDEN